MKCTPFGGSVGCSHDECVTGDPLSASCDPCVEKVCAEDPYCCCEGWDSLCVSEAVSICPNPCG